MTQESKKMRALSWVIVVQVCSGQRGEQKTMWLGQTERGISISLFTHIYGKIKRFMCKSCMSRNAVSSLRLLSKDGTAADRSSYREKLVYFR